MNQKHHSDHSQVDRIIFASARGSVIFALACLEKHSHHLRARSSFVDPEGRIMHWHEFGDLEGPGWAANSIGGASLLYQWADYTQQPAIQDMAIALVDHVLEDGFINEQSGAIWPYFDLAKHQFCWNYTHNNLWLCPGSLAKIGVQMLEFAALLPQSSRQKRLRQAALGLGQWLCDNTPYLPSGWPPRRITPDGAAYDQCPTGGPDAIFDHSADGLFLLDLWSLLGAHGSNSFQARVINLADTFVNHHGYWGSINHDTYDSNENVAYSTAFRVLRRAATTFNRPDWLDFAYQVALPGLDPFWMHEDRNGIATNGLLWMEKTWDTSYLWENAEAAQAYLEAWVDRGQAVHLNLALKILRAIANHHHGRLGFLTEGVDWNNHVSERHHVNGDFYGDINYTEPLLNNLHHLGPALFYFRLKGIRPPSDIDDSSAIKILSSLSSKAPLAGKD